MKESPGNAVTVRVERKRERNQMLQELFEIIKQRQAYPQKGSYTTQLLAGGEDVILRKVGEEALEVILATKGEGTQRLIEETADLFYHTLVLLAHSGLSLEDVETELRRRHVQRQTGG